MKTSTDFPSLDAVAAHLAKPLSDLGIEEIWSCVDYYAKFNAMLPNSPSWSDGNGSRDMKRALLRVYGRSCDQAAEQLPLSDNCTLVSLLRSVKNGDTLISFNYDTLVERLAQRLGHRLCVFGDVLKSDAVNFVKPHGSDAWLLDLKAKQVSAPTLTAPR